MKSGGPYLLDTDVVSNFWKKRPSPILLRWISRLNPVDLIIPMSVIFEIQRGIELARPLHPELAEEKEEWLDGLVSSGIRILAPSVDVIRLRARMTVHSDLRHFVLSDPRSTKVATGVDLTIAATAIIKGATIVSFNVKDFLAIHSVFPVPALIDARDCDWSIPRNRDVSSLGSPLTTSRECRPASCD